MKNFDRSVTPAYHDTSTGEAVMNIAGTVTANLSSGLIIPTWDYLSLDSSGSATDIYTFKTGGASGTTVATLTIVYTTNTKAIISTVTKV